jgi:hypothetical protein
LLKFNSLKKELRRGTLVALTLILISPFAVGISRASVLYSIRFTEPNAAVAFSYLSPTYITQETSVGPGSFSSCTIGPSNPSFSCSLLMVSFTPSSSSQPGPQADDLVDVQLPPGPSIGLYFSSGSFLTSQNMLEDDYGSTSPTFSNEPGFLTVTAAPEPVTGGLVCTVLLLGGFLRIRKRRNSTHIYI